MSGIEDIYNVVNKIAALPPESTPQNEVEESAYDTLENVVKSIRTSDIAPSTFVPGLPGPGGVITSPTGTGKARDGTLMSPEPPQRQLAPTPPGLQSSTVSMVQNFSVAVFFASFSIFQCCIKVIMDMSCLLIHYLSLSLSLSLSQPLTPRELKIIKQQQKLLEKLQKKAQKEADRRRQQEDKKRRRERKGKKGKVSLAVYHNMYYAKCIHGYTCRYPA